MNEAIRMQLCAFVDGELPENEAELLLRRMSQDAELRQQVAEYLAIGRAMRGDMQVPGIDRLRERVAGELGESLADDIEDDLAPEGRKYVRPVIGFAVAASVALVAIFGLRQFEDGQIDADNPQFADTIPSVEDLTENLRRRHEAEEELGAMLADYPADEELVEIPSPEDAADDADDTQADEPASDEAPIE